jgi:creatinine amidohydrolase
MSHGFHDAAGNERVQLTKKTDSANGIVLQDMTWREIASALERGVDTAIVVAGSIEQHGPHLPIRTDTLIGDELAVRVARKLGHALVAPTIRPGCSDHHMSMPGTISIRPEVLREILRDYCRSLAAHGFKKIVLLSSHGGNFAALETFAPGLVREFPKLRIVQYSDLHGFFDAWMAEVKKLGLPPEKVGGHACLGETSEMLHIRPDLVREDRFEPGFVGSSRGMISRILRDGMHTVSQNGILGDPRGATAEAGEALLEALADHLTQWAREELAD